MNTHREGLDVGVEPVFGARFGIADFGRIVGVGQDAGVAQDCLQGVLLT